MEFDIINIDTELYISVDDVRKDMTISLDDINGGDNSSLYIELDKNQTKELYLLLKDTLGY